MAFSSCAELVSRDDLDEIYGGTAVVDGEKIWLGEEFNTLKLYSTSLTPVSEQTAYRQDVGGKTLFYVNVGKIENFPLYHDSASTLYGNDYKVKIKYKWGDTANAVDPSALDVFTLKETIVGDYGEVRYTSSFDGVSVNLPDEIKALGVTDVESAKNKAKAIYDSEHGQKRELVVHTAAGYYVYTAFADFEVYAVFSYDAVKSSAEYTYVFYPVESSIEGSYLCGESEDFVGNAGDHQLITLDAYRLRQLMPEVFGDDAGGADGDGGNAGVTDGDDTPSGTVVATYNFSDSESKKIDDAGYYGLGLGSARDLLDLSGYAEYMNGEYEFRFTVTATYSFDKMSIFGPQFCSREFCLYDRMPPSDGITGIVSESTAHDEYGMIVCESISAGESLQQGGNDSFTWTVQGYDVQNETYLVYNAVDNERGDAEWTLKTVDVKIEIVKK